MNFHALRARVRALNVDGERPNTCMKPREIAQGVSPLLSPQSDRLREEFFTSSAANSSGQSANPVWLTV